MTIKSLLDSFGPEIDDPEEGTYLSFVTSHQHSADISYLYPESFLLFSQSIPSQNLGFVDQRATSLDLSINGRDLVIHQSPTILSSSRGGGTTGAVVWKITPRFASWIADSKSPFFAHDILKTTSSVLELGCGISGIIGLVLGPNIGSYTLSDQDYVSKLVNQNLLGNRIGSSSSRSGRKSNAKFKKTSVGSASATSEISNISFKSLDWETDEVSSVAGRGNSYDVVIACDCIYNDALIVPLVQTCVDSCRLRSENSTVKATQSETHDGEEVEPTVCVIAQQLRSDEVFEAWLKEFHRSFHVWRVPDEALMEGLREDSGFVVHIGVLR